MIHYQRGYMFLLLVLSSLSVTVIWGADTTSVSELPQSIVGERDTIRNLINEVKLHLQERGVWKEENKQIFDQFDTRLSDSQLDSEILYSVRKQLGEVVGQAASKYFEKDVFVVWTQNRWADVGPHDWPAKDAAFSKIELPVNMACQGYGSQSVLVTNTKNKTVRIGVKQALANGCPSITFRRGVYFACPDRKYRADALVLLSNNQLELAPGETICLWIQLDSHGAHIGKYTVPVILNSENTTVTVELNIEVFPVQMPEVLDCYVFNYAYLHESPLTKDIVPDALADLKNHYTNTYILPGAIPKAKADTEGNLMGPIDFSGLDKQVETYAKEGLMFGIYWGGWASNNLGDFLFPELEFLSEPWRKAVKTWYAAFIKHLHEDLGLDPSRYFMYIYDEKTTKEVQEVYAFIKSLAPEVKLMITPTGEYNLDELTSLAENVDIWVPNYDALVKPHPEDLDFLKATGKTVWTWSCVNGANLPVYQYYLRRHWHAWNCGITGVGFWAYADHYGSSNSWEWVLGAFNVIYTKEHAPVEYKVEETIVPSKRWDAWREGAQDYQLLNMLRQKISSSSLTDSEILLKTLQEVLDLVIKQPEDLEAADRGREIVLKALTGSSN